jgi:hypothetical protein
MVSNAGGDSPERQSVRPGPQAPPSGFHPVQPIRLAEAAIAKQSGCTRPMSASRSARTGRSIGETDIGSSFQDEGNSMLARQPRSAQDFMENALISALYQHSSQSLLRSRGSALAGFGAAPQPYFASSVDGSGIGYNSPAAPIPRSGLVHGWKTDGPHLSSFACNLGRLASC